MRKAIPAFDKVENMTPEDIQKGAALVIGYQEIKCYWIFDIKMDRNFTRKAQFVAGGQITKPPS
eukprot:10420008-Ditylum_brightwellii.AAC.1